MDVASVSAFFTESVHDQQAVVDPEPNTEHVDNVDREDRHVTELRRADENPERGQHSPDCDEQRHAGRGETAEEEDHRQDRDR